MVAPRSADQVPKLRKLNMFTPRKTEKDDTHTQRGLLFANQRTRSDCQRSVLQDRENISWYPISFSVVRNVRRVEPYPNQRKGIQGHQLLEDLGSSFWTRPGSDSARQKLPMPRGCKLHVNLAGATFHFHSESRDPFFFSQVGNRSGFVKERWLKEMGNQPLE